jgi:hypothetical protein
MTTIEQPKLSIDILPVQKSLLDLSDHSLPTDFGMDDYILSRLMDDVILIEFCDLESGEDGVEYVLRGGIAIPTAQIHNMWRKGKVILKGPNVRFTSIGEIVLFPANMGIQVSNIEVKDHGKVKKGLFLNEQRMFGACEVK